MYKETRNELDQIYTDGSFNPTNGRAGAVYTVIRNNVSKQKWRKGTYWEPCLLSASRVVMALRFLEKNTKGAVTCTDSKAALQNICKKTGRKPSYGCWNQESSESANQSVKSGQIPVDPLPRWVCWNERADVLAAEDAEGVHIEYILLKTLLQIRSIIR